MTVELIIPDLGDFEEVDVIEVLVAPGDTVAIEDPLVTLETDKASMDIPATAAGEIISIAVKVGDKVSSGTVLATLAPAAECSLTSPTSPLPRLLQPRRQKNPRQCRRHNRMRPTPRNW